MFKKTILLGIVIASVTFASEKPINQSIVEALASYGDDAQVGQSGERGMNIFIPRATTIFGIDVKRTLDRACLAYGGNIYIEANDNTLIAGFSPEKIVAMTDAEKAKYIELNPMNKKYFLIERDEYEKLYSPQRIRKGLFSLLDTDNFIPQNGYYNTICKNQSTGDLIYTATTRQIGNRFDPNILEIKFGESMNVIFSKKTTTKTIDEAVDGYVDQSQGNKIILKPYFNVGFSIITHYCDSAGGKLLVDGKHIAFPDSFSGFTRGVQCADTKNAFTLTKLNKGYLITKGESAILPNPPQIQSPQNDSFDVRKNFAVSVGDMPTGSTSETNIGNMKLVSTVYKNDGSSKLINVTEVGGNSAFKNYRVANGEAVDITDHNWAFTNLKLPQKLIDAKQKLVAQCTVYGASRLMIDNYSASCERQSLGGSCVANMIYARDDQFAGKESFNCAK